MSEATLIVQLASAVVAYMAQPAIPVEIGLWGMARRRTLRTSSAIPRSSTSAWPACLTFRRRYGPDEDRPHPAAIRGEGDHCLVRGQLERPRAHPLYAAPYRGQPAFNSCCAVLDFTNFCTGKSTGGGDSSRAKARKPVRAHPRASRCSSRAPFTKAMHGRRLASVRPSTGFALVRMLFGRKDSLVTAGRM